MIRSLALMYVLVMLVLSGILACGAFVYRQLAFEHGFHKRYGETWKEEYEDKVGPLSQAHIKIGIACFGLIAMPSLVFWLYKTMTNAATGAGRSRSRRSHGSPEERAAKYKRNAILCIYFGLGGMAAAVLLVFFHVGIFHDHANEMILAYFVFLASYCSVIAGCRWWLKAKGWTPDVAVIAIMPVALLFVPFVRRLILVQAIFLPVSMVMMTFALIVVTLVLPNKTSNRQSRRKRR